MEASQFTQSADPKVNQLTIGKLIVIAWIALGSALISLVGLLTIGYTLWKPPLGILSFWKYRS